jgi:outer membrane protein
VTVYDSNLTSAGRLPIVSKITDVTILMPRNRIFLSALIALGCWLAGMRQPAWALDPWGTEQDVVTGPFQATQDPATCDRGRIGKALTLPDAVDLALCNNPQTRAAWASARAQAASVGMNMSAYLPTLSAQGSLAKSRNTFSSQGVTSNSTSTSRSASLTASYLLYDFGARAASVESAKELLFAANASRDATLQLNFLAAVQDYYSLLAARSSVVAAQAAEDSAREALSAAVARYQAGVATPADKLQAQTSLSQATLNLITARGNERNAQGTLANVMGFDANQPFELAPFPESTPNPAVEQDIGKLIDEARHNRPDLAAADAQIKAAQAQVDASRAANWPTISLNASTGYQGVTGTQNVPGTVIINPGTRSWTNTLGVSINFPLFTGFRNTYQIRQAEQQMEGKVATRDQLANQVALDVWKAYQTLLTNSQALRTADDLVASATASEQMTLGRYKAGVTGLSIVDVLNAQSALASARQQRVAALYNFLASRIALAQAIGVLDLTQLDQPEIQPAPPAAPQPAAQPEMQRDKGTQGTP